MSTTATAFGPVQGSLTLTAAPAHGAGDKPVPVAGPQSADDRQMHFEVDQDLDIVVVKVVDTESGQVVRQFPRDEAIQVAKSLDRGMVLERRV